MIISTIPVVLFSLEVRRITPRTISIISHEKKIFLIVYGKKLKLSITRNTPISTRITPSIARLLLFSCVMIFVLVNKNCFI